MPACNPVNVTGELVIPVSITVEPLVGTAVAVYDVTVTPEPTVGAVYVYTMELAV